MEEGGKGQVWVARGVGTANLRPRRLLGPRLVERNPDQRRAVASRPGDVDRRLVARHEPFVRIDPLREDGADLSRVPQLAGDEGLPVGGEVPLVVTVEERVASLL